MTTDSVQYGTPARCGIGGPFLCLINGLTGYLKNHRTGFILCPVFTPFFILASVFFPPLFAVFVKGQLDRTHIGLILPPKRSDNREWLQLALLNLCWWILLYIAYRFIDYRTEVLLDIYRSSVQGQQVLQIATPEQLQYANSLTQTYCYVAYVLLLALSLIFTLSMSFKTQLPNAAGSALKGFFSNLPGYLVIITVMIVSFTILERYFAYYKLQAIESIVLDKKEFFDPAWPFLILRIYLSGAFALALALLSAGSIGIYKIAFSRK